VPKAVVTASGFYVPENVVTNDDLAKLIDTNDEWIVQRTGIKQRHYVAEGQTGAEMAETATRRACEEAGIAIDDIDFIVLGTLSPDYTMPGNVPYVQDRLDLNGCGIVEIRNQCTGFIYSLAIADKFIRTGDYKKILVVGEEIHSTGLDFSDAGRDVTVIFGDGAGVFVVEAGDDNDDRGIIKTSLGGDGAGAQNLWVECGDSASYHPRLTHEMIDEGRIWPKMKGKKVFIEAIRRMPESILAVLDGTGYTLADVDAFVFHQANLRINQMVAGSLEIPEEKVYNNIEFYGNTTAATIPIAFTEARQKGLIKPGSLVLISGFGAGYTWGSILLRY
jgi:3-oxoacyl-[acyl-carrier-protein] synthase III